MEPKFEFAMSVRIKLTKLICIPDLTKGGQRGFIGIEEGTFEGPNLKGVVLPGTGGDYAHIRPDGVLDFNARYVLQEEDGTYIYLQNRGFRWGSDEAMEKMRKHESVDSTEYYMRTSPTFEVSKGPHDWLCKYIFVGIGDKTTGGNVINYYKVL